ncbi:MAG: GTPase ObgE, partial [Chloroflexota bacterium]|nr:GTPase ObgE [Chloroflexota bacterium]
MKELQVVGGRGGDGAISFRREKFVPKGGPDGGDGGVGGAVVVQAVRSRATLTHLARTSLVRAEAGANGRGNNRTGRNGKGRVIEAPEGTTIWELDAHGGKSMLADLVSDGDRAVAARGGSPGRGNVRFANPTLQDPLLAEAGEPGEERRLLLEVRLLADAAIVGAPNAGKSTLLSVVSRAQPKIADYPFTTLEPVLGVVERHDRAMVLLDVPGLIEGASEGRGLGHDFLRHTERARLLIHLVDGLADDLAQDFAAVAAEIAAHRSEASTAPVVVAVTKQDVPEARERYHAQRQALAAAAGQEPLAVSAATGEGVERLLDRVLALLPDAPPRAREAPSDEPGPAPAPQRERVAPRVQRDGDAFVVYYRPA